MKELNKVTAKKNMAPERIVQFGEGNFLRAFADWIVWQMNRQAEFNSSVVIVQPIRQGRVADLEAQDCLYHVNLRGVQDGKPVDSLDCIDCVSRAMNPYADFSSYMALATQPDLRFIISNTTEAGIAFDTSCQFTDEPAASYPGKLTQWLYRRFQFFGGDPSRGLIIMPCELIFQNGQHLKECILSYIDLWQEALGEDYTPFRTWFLENNYVCSTLVDRIVQGAPGAEARSAIQTRLGYADGMIVQGEVFHLWVIEAPENMSCDELRTEFPAGKAGLNVKIVESEVPYHARKVTLLNGSHTVLSPVSWLSGVNIVRDACNHPVLGHYVRRVLYEELLPTLDLPADELKAYADSVLERFCNPYVDHQLTSIMLNAFPKFCTRDLPALTTYLRRRGCLPRGLVLGLAALIYYYKGDVRADGTPCVPNDDERIVELLNGLWQTGDVQKVVRGVLGAKDLIWNGADLNAIAGLPELLCEYIGRIESDGILATVEAVL